MKRSIVYVAIFLASFVGFVVAFAPAATVWQLAGGNISRRLPDLSVLSIGGTAWSGHARIRYQNFPETRLEWSLSPFSLLRGGIAFTAVASGDGLHVETHGTLRPSGFEALATGHVDAGWVNPVSNQGGLTFSGRLTIQRLHLVSDYRWFSGAAGTLHWNGGQVIYRTGRGLETIVLPPLDGTLGQAGGNLQLVIRNGVHTLIGIVLRRTGWVTVNVKVRLMQTANLPWPAGEAPDATALSLEEQLFPPQ